MATRRSAQKQRWLSPSPKPLMPLLLLLLLLLRRVPIQPSMSVDSKVRPERYATPSIHSAGAHEQRRLAQSGQPRLRNSKPPELDTRCFRLLSVLSLACFLSLLANLTPSLAARPAKRRRCPTQVRLARGWSLAASCLGVDSRTITLGLGFRWQRHLGCPPLFSFY